VLTGDVVKSRYETLEAARADALFSRGWLPDILPPSSRNISVSNNLDLNTSVGEFSFAPTEFDLLQAKLSPLDLPEHPFTDSFDAEIERHVLAGHPAHQYIEDHSTWVFLCHPAIGSCEYTMWLRH
jgi:hypothetical protein